MSFEELWDFITKKPRGIVQDKTELEYVYNLMRGCNSYLEVGTAEGKSLYVLTNAMPKGSSVTYIDLGEPTLQQFRDDMISGLTDYKITPIHGNSNSWDCYEKVKDKKFDVVMIDAGHKLFNVLIDAAWYGPLATKYLVFHDITIPDVNQVFEWYTRMIPNKGFRRVINSTNYGYGIIECQ